MDAVGTSFWWILSVFKPIFESVSSTKLIEEFEGTIWTVSKKGRGLDPLDPPPPFPLDAHLLVSATNIYKTLRIQ